MTIASRSKCFAGLALTLALIVGATATAQAGGGRANGTRASGATFVASQSGPVVRDHRGQAPSGAPTSSGSGWNGQVRDHRSGHQFCFGGLFGTTQCTQL